MNDVAQIVALERVCKVCATLKPFAEFHAYGPDRLSWKCRECHTAHERARQKALWASDPEYRARHNAAGKAYRRGEVKPPKVARALEVERNCGVCGVTKEIGSFPLRGSGRRLRTCLICYNAMEADKARARYRSDFDYRNKKLIKRERPSGRKARSHTTEYRVQYFYGVTFDHVKKTLDEQMGLCANRACGAEISWDALSGTKNRAVIDHDHKTGKFRAVLCHPCNILLGHVEKSKNKLLGLFEYHVRHCA